ncbi:MAG: hypothetical protein H6719_23890 [Sandaracinaceae bacterium]|nr:hypothetical protein [Sandaracinaceae bacterium]
MDAKCGHHPDRVADGGTCARCGTYLCAECRVEGSDPALCSSCLTLLDRGKDVRHIRILAILMMIHGGLLAAMGAYYVLFGGFVLDALADIPVAPGDESSEFLPEILVSAFALIGLTQVGPGVVQALGGWRLFQYRGLALGWIGALGGLLGVLGCYCAPTGIALAMYATYVLSRDDVRARIAVGVPPSRAKKPAAPSLDATESTDAP